MLERCCDGVVDYDVYGALDKIDSVHGRVVINSKSKLRKKKVNN